MHPAARRVLVACLGVALGVGASACGELTPKLDMGKIERGVARAAKAQFGRARVGDGVCPPPRKEREGDRFECHVDIDGQQARYRVTQIDDHGGVEVALADEFVLARTAVDHVRDEIRRTFAVPESVTCGDAFVYVVSGPRSIECSVRLSAKQVVRAAVAVNESGNLGSVTLKP